MEKADPLLLCLKFAAEMEQRLSARLQGGRPRRFPGTPLDGVNTPATVLPEKGGRGFQVTAHFPRGVGGAVRPSASRVPGRHPSQSPRGPGGGVPHQGGVSE